MTPLVTEEEVRALCGRKAVAARQAALTQLLVSAFESRPRHRNYPHAVALSFSGLRGSFGEGGQRIVVRFFTKVGNYLKGRWSNAYVLNPATAQRVERHLKQIATLDRKPFRPVVRPVGKTGLRLPDSIGVSLAHLNGVIDRVQATILQQGPHTPFAARLGSSQTLEAVYRQLLAVRHTIIETGGLPNTYSVSKSGRWTGSHEHHVLRLARPTRYLTLGPQEGLWDCDLSSAHLALAAGLMATWHPDTPLPMLTRYLSHRDEWLDELRRRLAEDVPRDDLKSIPLAWLHGARRSNRHSTSPALRAAGLPEALTALDVWDRLYVELRGMAVLLAPHSPLKRGSPQQRLSRLLTHWESQIMQRLGLRLTEAGVGLAAWLFDGFLLVEGHSNPTDTLEKTLGVIRADLAREGFRFDCLGVKVKSVDRLYQEVSECLG